VNVTATLLGQAGTLLVLVWFVMRFLWKPLMAAMDARSDRIADGLAAAERSQRELELAEKKAAERLREAKQEAAEIVAQANKRATEVIEESKLDAQAEGQRQLEAARAEIEQEVNRSKAHLREQFSTLVLHTAEKVLERELNAQTHADYIQRQAANL
jgi:F-type H+-transporting ATPase subunit b